MTKFYWILAGAIAGAIRMADFPVTVLIKKDWGDLIEPVNTHPFPAVLHSLCCHLPRVGPTHRSSERTICARRSMGPTRATRAVF